jgi:hypothetical protein
MASVPRPKNNLPEDLRRRLNTAHAGLLRVHKALIDYERTRYERERAPISGPGEFLQLLIHDPWFAWLRPISELAALIDETVSTKDPVDPVMAQALLAKSKELLVPAETGDPFSRGYHRALHESPEVAAAHGEWKLSTGREIADVEPRTNNLQ